MILRENHVNVILVYLLMFTSGSMVFMRSDTEYLIAVIFMAVAAWYFFSDRRISEGFVLYVCLFTGFLFVIVLYTKGSLSVNTVISRTLQLVLAYFVLKTLGEKFIETYIKVIVFLAIVSLFGLLTDIFSLFDGVIRSLPQVNRRGDPAYEGILYLFRYSHQEGRNNSIFFEPGAYQGFLNAGLFMLLFLKTDFTVKKKWVYIGVLLTTLVTTGSTTGYLIFAVMFGLFVIKSDALPASGKMLLSAVVVIIGITFATRFEYVIVEKLGSYLSSESLYDSRNLRSFDARIDLEIFKRNIFGVGFNEYVKKVSAIGLVGEGQTSSNGITSVLAIYGLPFWLFLFASYFLAFRRLLDGWLISVMSFGMLMMFFMGESYYVFRPICMAVIAGAFTCEPRSSVRANH